MLAQLKKIKELITADQKKVKVNDILIDLLSGKVDQFVCHYPRLLMKSEALIAPFFVTVGVSRFTDQPIFEFLFEKHKIGDFRHRSAIKTFTEEAEKYFVASSEFANLEKSTNLDFQKVKNRKDRDGILGRGILSLKSVDDFYIESPDLILGRFYDLVVDTSEWKLKYVVVDVLSGVNHDLRVIPFNTLQQLCWVPGVLMTDLRGIEVESLQMLSDLPFTDEKKILYPERKRVGSGEILY